MPTFNCICIYASEYKLSSIQSHRYCSIGLSYQTVIDTVQIGLSYQTVIDTVRLDCHIRPSCWFIHVNRFRCGSQPWSCESDDRGGSAWRGVSQEQESVSTLYTTLELEWYQLHCTKQVRVCSCTFSNAHTTETTIAHSEYGVHSFEASSTCTDKEILGLKTLGFPHFRNLPKPK